MPASLLLVVLLAAGQIGTGDACRQKMDLCFALDGSSTVCGGDKSCENWDLILKFSQAVATTLNIGPSLDRVALATFFNTTKVEWNLKKYSNKNSVWSAIGGVLFKGGVFNDLPSVNYFVSQVFNPVSGDDIGLLGGNKNVAIMITDGNPVVSNLDAQAASLAVQKYGITVFVVGIQPGCTKDWAQAIASKPEKADLNTVFMVDDYASLDGVRGALLEQICYFLEPPETKPLVDINITLTVG